jgi:hypothetical protein
MLLHEALKTPRSTGYGDQSPAVTGLKRNAGRRGLTDVVRNR